MSRRVTRSSWSIEPHPDWEVVDVPECLTITKPGLTGAFQLSSAIKEQGTITLDEVMDFASEEPALMGVPSEVRFGNFFGFEVAYLEADQYWHRYWLADSNILVLATYNSSSADWHSVTSEVHKMLNSLKLNIVSA